MKIINVACPLTFKGACFTKLQGFPPPRMHEYPYEEIAEFMGAGIYLGMKNNVYKDDFPMNPILDEGQRLNILG